MRRSANKDDMREKTRERQPAAVPPLRVLFIKSSSLGDIFHAFPAFYLLSAACPNCEIDWLINTEFAPVLEYIKSDVHRIIHFDREKVKSIKAPTSIFKLVKAIRKERYDLVVDVQGLIRSSLMTFVARAEKKVGFAAPREGLATLFYSEKVKIPKKFQHAIEKNAYLISRAINIRYVVPNYILQPISRHQNGALKALKKCGINSSKYIVFAPGARWETKRWSTRFFAVAADAISLANPKLDVVLVGAASDKQIASEIVSKCKVAKPVSMVGKTSLCRLVEVLRGAGALLTNDSGPMHIAAALRIPVFALFGPTAPEKTGPFWQWHKTYQNNSGCVRCFKKECKSGMLECQKGVLPEKVAGDIINKIQA